MQSRALPFVPRRPQNLLLREVYDILEGHIPVATRLGELHAKYRFTEEEMSFFIFAHGELGVKRLPEFEKFLAIREAKPKKQSIGAPNHPDSIRPFLAGLDSR